MDLPAGVHFWRLQGIASGAILPGTSATWEFFSGARSAPVDTSWGTTLDVNGDGLADLAIQGRDNSVLVYLGSPAGVGPAPAIQLTSAHMDHEFNFGASVASAGDVNGDGFGDLVVSSSTGQDPTFSPNVYLFLGGPSGVSTQPMTIVSGIGGAGSGAYGVVAGAGDLNGDGYGDLAVGVPNVSYDTGEVEVFYGTANGLGPSPDLTVPGLGANGAQFGVSIAAALDVNADGHPDIAVGTPRAPYPDETGEVFVFVGNGAGYSSSPLAILVGPDGPSGFFGSGVAALGDTDGDGRTDIGISAYDADRLYVFQSAGGTVAAMPSWSATGRVIASAGDVNADGFGDFVIGVPGDFGTPGQAAVYLGSASGLAMSASSTLMGAMDFGVSVVGPGDVNGDGFADVIVNVSRPLEASLAYPGSASGINATAGYQLEVP